MDLPVPGTRSTLPFRRSVQQQTFKGFGAPTPEEDIPDLRDFVSGDMLA